MGIPFKEVKLSEVILDPSEPTAFDTETCGLYGKIRLAQFFQKGWSEVLLVNWPDPFELAGKLNETLSYMHNASYDISTIQAATSSKFIPINYDDTFLLARLKYFHCEKFDLASVMEYVLGFDPYEEAGFDKKLMQKTNWDVLALTETQKQYAAIDVFYLPDVYDAVKECKEVTSYKLDMLTLNYCLDFQNNGMPVINELLQERYAKNLAEIESYNMPINVNSWKQVRPYIQHDESDDLALAILSLKGNDKAKAVRTVRKLIKQNSFLNKFDTPDERIYGKFLPSARSGRLTSKDQNLQQIPRALKGMFGYSTDDGRILVYADYAQLEMRTICAITGEMKMAGLLREGADVHDYTAKMLFGENFTKEQRQVAKTANFGLLYGAGVTVFLQILIKLAELFLQEHEGTIIKRKWRNLWTAIASWQDTGMTDWRQGKAWQTPFGRKYLASRVTDQLNIQNQGFGGEVAKLALHYMKPELDKIPGVLMCNFIHDSYIVECENNSEVYEKVAAIIAESMQKAWFEALRTGTDVKIRDLPMPVEVFVGYNWGRIEDDYLYKLELEGMHYYEA